MINVALEVATEKRREIKKVQRMKQNTDNKNNKKDDSMGQHGAFYAHVISP